MLHRLLTVYGLGGEELASLQALGLLSASEAASAARALLQTYSSWRPPAGDTPHQLAFLQRLAVHVSPEPAELWACGDNSAGQTGVRIPSDNPVLNLTRVRGVPLALHVAAGATHSLLVGSDGNLYAAGADFNDGRLGLGLQFELFSAETGDVLSSHQTYSSGAAQHLPLANEYQAQSSDTVAAQSHAAQNAPAHNEVDINESNAATTSNAALPVQQENAFTEQPILLQQRKRVPYRRFTRVPLDGHVPVACAAGSKHSVVLTSTGIVLVAGDNSRGQLGFPDRRDRFRFCEALLPREARRIVQIAAGSAHTLILSETGAVYACGENRNAQLGLGPFAPSSISRFVEIYLPEGACYISAGDEHSLLVGSSRRTAYGTGLNCTGQLGTSDRLDRVNFCALDCNLGKKGQTFGGVARREDEFICSASAGGSHSLLLTTWGRLLATGECFMHEGESRRRSSFRAVAEGVSYASAGWSHSIAVRRSPRCLAVVGDNTLGPLGMGDVHSRDRFSTAALAHPPVLVAAGRGHTLVLAQKP